MLHLLVPRPLSKRQVGGAHNPSARASHAHTHCCAAPADEKGKFDELIEEHGVRLLIDPAALMHVLGTTMDFVDEPLK
jgi:Fe-S cluster assembly iron-binding protein IscA